MIAATVAAVSDALARAGCKPFQRTNDGVTVALCPCCGKTLEARHVPGGSVITCAGACSDGAVAVKLGVPEFEPAQARTAPKAPTTKRRNEGASGTSDSSSACLVTASADTIAPRPVRWLWTGRIPFGMVTIIEGQPGLSKSILTMDLAARVSSGAGMPLRRCATSEDGRDVVVLSYEDDPACTIRPRLEAAGADLARVHIVQCVRGESGGDRAPMVPEDLKLLATEVLRHSAALVIVDPLMAALSSDVDAHRDQDVRRALSRMRDLAESTGAAVVLVRHLRKAATVGQAITAGQGSIGIVGAARAAHVVAVDPDDDGCRVLAPVKCNVGELPRAVRYRLTTRTITDGITAPCIEWLGECDATADGLTGSAPEPEERGALSDAAEFLRRELADSNKTVAEIKAAAKEAGIAWRTVERAKGPAKATVYKSGFGPGASWKWRLKTAKTANTGELADFAKTANESGSETTENPTKTANFHEDRQPFRAGEESKNAAPPAADLAALGGASADGPEPVTPELRPPEADGGRETSL